MIVIDANLFLYAYNSDAPQQRSAAQWLSKALGGGEPIALPWVTIWAFLRISTNSRIWTNPIPARDALKIVSEWLAQPGVIALRPGPLHAEILARLINDYGCVGPLVTDAVIAALAIENGAVLASTDQDFHRFPDLRWVNPLGS